MKKALEHLISSFAVVIHGRPGEGKTVCAFHLVKCMIDKGLISLDKCVLLSEPDDIKYVRTDQVDLILIDNIFGKHNADPSKLSGWRNYFDTLESYAAGYTVKIIAASRSHILLEYKNELFSYNVFTNRVLLRSSDLSVSEKKDILISQLSSFNRTMTESDIEACISQSNSDVGFPLCCQQFSSDEKLFCKGSEFFSRSYITFLESNLRVLKTDSLLALLYVFYRDNLLSTKDLNISKISSDSKAVLEHLAELYGVTEPLTVILRQMKKKIDNFTGSFLKAVNGSISFIHDTIYETVARLVLEEYPEEVITHCTVDFLCQCVCLEEGHEGEIGIGNEHFGILAQRFIDEVVAKRNGKSVSKHPVLHNQDFLKELFAQLTKSEECFREFFSAGLSTQCTGIHAFLYHAMTDGRNEDFLRQALHHLRCDHHDFGFDSCWKCQVKQEALAAVCEANQYETYNEMVQDGVMVTGLCLYKAVENQAVRLELVSTILQDLKRTNKFILDNRDLQNALGMSMRHKDTRVFEILQRYGLRATVHFLYFAVQIGDARLLSTTIKDLQDSKKWKVDNYFVSRALIEALVRDNKEMIDILTSAGAKLNNGAVYWAVEDHGLEEVQYVVQKLKETQTFDNESHNYAWSLASAMKQPDRKIYNFLKKEGAVSTTTLVLAMTEIGQPAEEIRKVVDELQHDGRWNTDDRFIAGAYMFAIKRGNKTLQNILETAGVGMCPGCFYYAVIFFPKEIENIVEQLKALDRFDPFDKNIARALVWATEYSDSSMCDRLHEAGLSFNMASLVAAVEISFSLSTLKTVIYHLKTNDIWEPKSDFALEALNKAYKRQDKIVYERLLSEGIEWTPRNLFLATKWESVCCLKKVLTMLSEKKMLHSSCPEIQEAISLARSYKSGEKYKAIKQVCSVSR